MPKLQENIMMRLKKLMALAVMVMAGLAMGMGTVFGMSTGLDGYTAQSVPAVPTMAATGGSSNSAMIAATSQPVSAGYDIKAYVPAAAVDSWAIIKVTYQAEANPRIDVADIGTTTHATTAGSTGNLKMLAHNGFSQRHIPTADG